MRSDPTVFALDVLTALPKAPFVAAVSDLRKDFRCTAGAISAAVRYLRGKGISIRKSADDGKHVTYCVSGGWSLAYVMALDYYDRAYEPAKAA